MSIAQHSVAGEGETRPSADLDNEALSTDAVNLPWVILRAVHHASRLDGVPARARAVLAALARTVDAAHPYGQIFARRELLTARAMQSERSFYRSLSDLETAGLIDRPAQRRYVEAGLFGRAYLHLTERAAILLGLVEPPVEATDDPVDKSGAEAFIQPSDSVADGAIYKDLSPTAFQKRQPGQVPADLQRLRPLGFRDFLIFKLMREARERGKRLSDIVAVTWEHLRQAKRPICYLQALLRSHTDFGYEARRRAVEVEAKEAAAAERQDAMTLINGVAGQAFTDDTGERQFVVEADGQTLVVYEAGEGPARRTTSNWQIGFARALRNGKLHAIPHECASRPEAVPVHVDTSRIITETGATHLKAILRLVRRP